MADKEEAVSENHEIRMLEGLVDSVIILGMEWDINRF